MTNSELKQDVENALDWEPSVDARDIGVSVDDRVVTLRGNVGSCAEKWAAERVALHVYGMKTVANDLEVRPATGYQRTDADIAQASVAHLKGNAVVPQDRVTVAVSNGWVTLNGTVEWQYQKVAAARAVRDLTGVKGVTNGVVVKPRVSAIDVQAKIETAFKRSAEIDNDRLTITP